MKAGEEKTVLIYLPAQSFMLFDENGIAQYVAQGYEISIGGSQPDKRSCEHMGKKPLILTIE